MVIVQHIEFIAAQKDAKPGQKYFWATQQIETLPWLLPWLWIEDCNLPMMKTCMLFGGVRSITFG